MQNIALLQNIAEKLLSCVFVLFLSLVLAKQLIISVVLATKLGLLPITTVLQIGTMNYYLGKGGPYRWSENTGIAKKGGRGSDPAKI